MSMYQLYQVVALNPQPLPPRFASVLLNPQPLPPRDAPVVMYRPVFWR